MVITLRLVLRAGGVRRTHVYITRPMVSRASTMSAVWVYTITSPQWVLEDCCLGVTPRVSSAKTSAGVTMPLLFI